jgi:hypothetical protein
VRFHSEHAKGLDPASALREAQLALLADKPDALPTWAVFEVIGGGSKEAFH